MKFKADQTSQKLRGGYYTPQNLADYVAKWVLNGKPSTILEPSCGDGVFFQALHNNNCSSSLAINGYELITSEVKKSKKLCKSLQFTNCSIKEGDFLAWASKQTLTKEKLFDAVLGNPPFIRYQFLEKEFQEHTEEIFDHLRLKFTKHTNAWVPFILASISMLKEGGRLGMVIPSEIIHVMHAQSLRTYLGNECSKIVLIDPKEIWFTDTLQGAVILLAQKKKQKNRISKGVGIKYVSGFDFMKTSPETIFKNTVAINGETVKGKWTKALLKSSEIKLIKKIMSHKDVHKFSDIAQVDVGIVTGANKFFLTDKQTVEKYNLKKFVKPMFGKSQHCQGVIYDRKQHNFNSQNGLPTNFIYLEDDFDTLPASVQEYIKLGETEDLHKRYKCRIRKPWYKVPSVYSTKIGMLKRSHDTPRLIFNKMEAFTTDTAYRISSDSITPEKLTYCFLNPLTAIFAEIEGRYYGGGVLELVPSEIENLYVPIPKNLKFDIKDLDDLVRSTTMTEVLREQAEFILKPLGLSKKEIDLLLSIWERLKNRRQRK